jgi:hypothetical protein
MVVDVAQIGAGALTVSGGTIVGTTVTTAQYQGLRFVYASTGTTWYSIAPNATTPGMTLVTPTSIANSGGSATASGGEVTFTGVSSISLNGVFTTTYPTYLLQVNFTAASTQNVCNFRYRAAGADNSGAGVYQYQSVYNGGTVNATSSSFPFGTVDTTAGLAFLQMQIAQPATSLQHLSAFQSAYLVSGSRIAEYGSLLHNVVAAYDGLTFLASTGNFTGKVRVYGLKNS